MIVSGGENVFPREVEDLLADHDGDRRGRGLRRRRRGVRPAPEGGRRHDARARRSSEDDLKAYVKENLAGYKVPREVEFVDELPRNATGKVLKRELARAARRSGGLATRYRVCGDAPAHRHLRSRPPGAHLGRGPPARPRRAARAVRLRRRALRVKPALVPVAARRLAHDRRAATRCACASTSALTGPCMRCLEPAAPAFEVDAREVHQPGGGEELHEPLRRRRRARPARLGARRARARAAGADDLPPGLRGPVPAVRREPQRGPRARARGAQPDPRWAKLRELKLD